MPVDEKPQAMPGDIYFIFFCKAVLFLPQHLLYSPIFCSTKRYLLIFTLNFDIIFFNEKQELTEGTRSNVVLQIEGKLYTPPVKSGILNGIYRQHLLNTGKVKEKTLYKKDLLNAEKIFCINSVRGMVEVEL